MEALFALWALCDAYPPTIAHKWRVWRSHYFFSRVQSVLPSLLFLCNPAVTKTFWVHIAVEITYFRGQEKTIHFITWRRECIKTMGPPLIIWINFNYSMDKQTSTTEPTFPFETLTVQLLKFGNPSTNLSISNERAKRKRLGTFVTQWFRHWTLECATRVLFPAVLYTPIYI